MPSLEEAKNLGLEEVQQLTLLIRNKELHGKSIQSTQVKTVLRQENTHQGMIMKAFSYKIPTIDRKYTEELKGSQ